MCDFRKVTSELLCYDLLDFVKYANPSKNFGKLNTAIMLSQQLSAYERV